MESKKLEKDPSFKLSVLNEKIEIKKFEYSFINIKEDIIFKKSVTLHSFCLLNDLDYIKDENLSLKDLKVKSLLGNESLKEFKII